MCCEAHFDHCREVVFQHLERKTPKPVITSEFENHNRWLKLLQCGGQSRQSSDGGFSTHAGVGNGVAGVYRR